MTRGEQRVTATKAALFLDSHLPRMDVRELRVTRPPLN